MSNGSGGNEKIRVAFLLLGSAQWLGGLHYLKNLLYALSTLEDARIEPFIFVSGKVEETSLAPLKPYAEIVRTQIVDKKGAWWWLWKGIFLLTGSNIIINSLFRRYGIQVVSHADIVDRWAWYKTINWIPDLQHLRLPGMFSSREIFFRDKKFAALVKRSDSVVVSSENAQVDVNSFVPGYEDRVKVLRFVSQPDHDRQAFSKEFVEELLKKYGLPENFFYLPNQFWKHKNHRVVLEAVNILKQRGKRVVVVCSGHMGDFRNPGHIDSLLQYIRQHDLEKDIFLLGLIDYSDVFALMRQALAVINPSLFEGWSSTVEEAKSMGKGMILSDIGVHREQNPPGSEYFDPEDPENLADILARFRNEKIPGPDSGLEERAREALAKRTREFARTYQDLVLSVSGS